MDSIQGNRVNKKRRHFLTAMATVIGGIGAVATAVPFISTLSPSAKTKAVGGPVEVDISGLRDGEKTTVKWRGKPVFILHRSDEAIKDLATMGEQLDDPESSADKQPEYARNEHRSINPQYLIVIGLCTHLGCSPKHVSSSDKHSFGADWKGGFVCPCHGSRFDLAGRVFKNVPAPSNLEVPKYQFISENVILIGDDSASS